MLLKLLFVSFFVFRSNYRIVSTQLSDAGTDGRRSDGGDRREGTGTNEERKSQEEGR